MWIEKQKNGTYKYCEYTKDITGKRRKVTVTLPTKDTKSKKIAQEILRSKSMVILLIIIKVITSIKPLEIKNGKYYGK